MALIPWKPFSGLDKFFDDEDWFFPVIPNTPMVDIYETDKNVIAEIGLPGIDPNKVDISIENQILRITGSLEDKKEEKKKNYWRKEIKKGSFERAISLPTAVKEDKANAVYDKGILKITMPKLTTKPQKKKIKIKVNKK